MATARVAHLLVTRGEQLLRAKRTSTKFTGVAAADELLNDLKGTPHAFVLACVADRQMRTRNAWLIPYELAGRLGGFSFDVLRTVSPERMQRAFLRPSPLHRFPQEMSRSYHAAIERIADVYGGNAAAIWRDKPSSADVVLRFLEFHGVGPKIATMAANTLARDFKVPFSDYHSVDVSVDVHLRRVFTRLGLIAPDATVEEVVYRARALCPRFPGLMDLPAWEVGRKWCTPKDPDCPACFMRPVCPTANGAVRPGR